MNIWLTAYRWDQILPFHPSLRDGSFVTSSDYDYLLCVLWMLKHSTSDVMPGISQVNFLKGIFALDEDRWYLENQMTMRLSSWQSLRPRCYDARWAKKKKPTVILHCGTSDWRLQLQLNHNIQETLVNCMNYSQPAQTKFSTFLDQEGYYCFSVWAMSDL